MEQEKEIIKMLHEIGTPENLRGYYYYLIEAIKITIANKETVLEMTKNIYDPVGKQFGVTAKQVSTAITRAIERTWDCGDLDMLCNYLGDTIANAPEPPSNSEFIAVAAEKIRL